MRCSTVQVTIHLGKVCNRTHYITFNTEQTFLEFQILVSKTFGIPRQNLALLYTDTVAEPEYILNSSTYPRLHSRSHDRIVQLTVRDVQWELLNIVQDFCTALERLEEWQSELLSTEEFEDGEADELREIILTIKDFGETGLYPWQSPACENNRVYFYQLNLSRSMVTIARHVRDFHMSQYSRITARGFPTSLKIGQITILRYVILHVMWNFLATRSDREHWYVHGALGMVLDAFIDSALLAGEHQDQLAELSIGCLVQLVEIEEARLELCQNEKFMQLFSGMLLKVRNTEHANEGDLYPEQLKFNTLMCMLSSPTSHKQFLKYNILDTLIAIMSYTTQTVATSYFYSLCIAFIFGFSFNLTPAAQCTTCKANVSHDGELCIADFLLSSIVNFWKTYTPLQQYEFESEKQYVWITMKPFVELAWIHSNATCSYHGHDVIITDDSFIVKDGNKLPIAKLMGVWALDSVMRNKDNVKLIYTEGLEDFVGMLGWQIPQFKLREAIDCVCSDGCDNKVLHTAPHPPSLQNICRAKFIAMGRLSPQQGINTPLSEIIHMLQQDYSSS